MRLFLQHGASAETAGSHHAYRGHLHKAVINRRPEAVLRALLEGGGRWMQGWRYQKAEPPFTPVEFP